MKGMNALISSEMFTTFYERLQQVGELQRVYEEVSDFKLYQVKVYEYKDKKYIVKLVDDVAQVVYGLSDMGQFYPYELLAEVKSEKFYIK